MYVYIYSDPKVDIIFFWRVQDLCWMIIYIHLFGYDIISLILDMYIQDIGTSKEHDLQTCGCSIYVLICD